MFLALIFAHVVDIHLPTSADLQFEHETQKERANERAEETLNNPDSTESDLEEAIEQLFGPNGNRV
jgi:hypothetical protein